MNFDLTDDLQLFQDQIRKFVEREVAPGARERDVGEVFPGEILRKLGETGYLGGTVSPEYGGAGMDYLSYGILIEEIGRADSSLRSTISVQLSLVMRPIEIWGSEEIKRRYLPKLASGEMIGCFGLTEPNAGSDAAAQQTTAIRDGDHYVLNGQKMWITNGGKAHVALVIAQTKPGGGTDTIAAFVVDRDTPGFSTADIHGKLGLRSSNTGQLFFADCRVPADRMVGKVG
ncbi:MAG: acyl-CoA dehydrogenase family protein, partial [Myxococcales bacterium]|nr:acyl-CoA dehydrogenase family protein [Myxococcales bacterium]